MDSPEPAYIEAARRGDPQAFRQLVETHTRPVFQLCWRITRDTALAEDAAQEAFYNAWRGLACFDGRAAFSTWLHRIAANAALEQLRRNARHRHEATGSAIDAEQDDGADFLADHDDGQPDPLQRTSGQQLGQHIERQLEAMSALERTAFVLRHVEGESMETIAQTLSINIGQSKQAVFRAVRKLRGALQAWR